MAKNHYSEVTWENGQLEIHLRVSQAALHAAEEEASAVRAQLTKSNAMVAGKMNSMKAFTLIVFITLILIFFLFCDCQP